MTHTTRGRSFVMILHSLQVGVDGVAADVRAVDDADHLAVFQHRRLLQMVFGKRLADFAHVVVDVDADEALRRKLFDR